MKWLLLLFISVASAAVPRSAEALAEFLKAFAAESLTESQVEILKSEELAGASIPLKATESRHVVTFLHRVRNISRIYQICVVESPNDQILRVSLGEPDGACQDELLQNFARFKGQTLEEKEQNTLQGYLWAQGEPKVMDLEAKLRSFWTAGR